uniref:Uncharacterized protein n=1 Tax=Anguilla anguilla TaxID=7936 RepID=A0A0E9SUH4_ANGAN
MRRLRALKLDLMVTLEKAKLFVHN